MSEIEITPQEREQFCKMAYTYGYEYFGESYIEYDSMEEIRILCDESRNKKSKKAIIRKVEDYFGFEREIHDWDNFGIFGLIEDITVCYEAGARNGLDDENYNPERISHMWEY